MKLPIRTTLTPCSNSNRDWADEWQIYSNNTQSIMCPMKPHIFNEMRDELWLNFQ